MVKYKIAEKFVSINGEGTRAGQLAVFIRLCGCNLNCSYCDTTWANDKHVVYEELSAEELIQYVKDTGVHNVTLTGGEPLLHRPDEDIKHLLIELSKLKDVNIEIETNGSVDLSEFVDIGENISFTMDYKLPESGMEKFMCLKNFNVLKSKDTVKFVSGSRRDLDKAKSVIDTYNLTERCHVYISPVFGMIEPVEIVEYMMDNRMNKINLQLQLHKLIWDPEKKGV